MKMVGASRPEKLPTATQTMAFRKTNPNIIPIAGNGSFRNPGIRPWHAIARLLILFSNSGIPILTDLVV